MSSIMNLPKKTKFRQTLVLLVSCCLFLVISGCDGGLLDTSPDYKYVESNFWESPAAANAALTGTYAILRWDGIYGNEATPLWEETASPNAYNYGNSKGFDAIALGQQTATTGGVITLRWERAYGGIGRANTFIAKVQEVEMDEALKDRMIAEAKFLRALYYFKLATRSEERRVGKDNR